MRGYIENKAVELVEILYAHGCTPTVIYTGKTLDEEAILPI